MTTEERGTIREDEYHPAADHAMAWFGKWKYEDFVRYNRVREAIASTALSGNRVAEICNSTLDRLESGQPVSDRYLLGLCWFIKEVMRE